MFDLPECCQRQETWLAVNGKLHRPTSKEQVSWDEFREQRKDDVTYIVYRFVVKSWSDGQGGKPVWEQVKVS